MMSLKIINKINTIKIISNEMGSFKKNDIKVHTCKNKSTSTIGYIPNEALSNVHNIVYKIVRLNRQILQSTLHGSTGQSHGLHMLNQ